MNYHDLTNAKQCHCYFRSNCFAPSCTASLQRDILDYRETKYRIPQMCSYTILGLRPIENLKARKELVIRCTKFIQRIVSWASSFIDWLKRMMCKDAFSWNMVPFTDVCNKGKAGLLLSTSQGCGIIMTWIHMLDGYGTKIFVLRKPRFIPVRIMTCF